MTATAATADLAGDGSGGGGGDGGGDTGDGGGAPNVLTQCLVLADGLVNKDSSRAPTGLHTQINWNCNVTPKQNIKELLEKKREQQEEIS